MAQDLLEVLLAGLFCWMDTNRLPCTPARALSPSAAVPRASKRLVFGTGPDAGKKPLLGLPQPIHSLVLAFLDCASILRLLCTCKASHTDIPGAVRDLQLTLPDDLPKLRSLRAFQSVRTLCANVGRAASNNTADGRRQRGAPAVNYLTMVLGFSFGAFELDAVRLLFADDAPRLYGAEVALSVGHCIPRTLLEVCVSGGLSGQGAMDFAAALRRGACPKLQKLVLHHNRLGPSAACELGAAVGAGALPELTVLSLDHSDIYDNGVVELAKGLALGGCPRLEVLSLRATKFFSEAASTAFGLLAASKQCPALVEFNLTGNCIFELGVECFSELLRLGALRGLQRLSLESTFLDDEGAVSIASSIRQADMRALEVISLRGNKIGNRGATQLGRLLADGILCRLKVLDLGFNFLSDVGVAELSAALRVCSTLRSVILDDNAFGDKGLACLIDAITSRQAPSKQSCLAELSISFNKVTEVGVRPLLNALLTSPALSQLETLGLSSCGLQEGSMAQLTAALRQGVGKRLRLLLLSNNAIGDGGATTLAQALASGACPELTCLRLRSNGIADCGVMELAKMVASRACPKLAALYIKGNNFSDMALRVLEHSCAADCS